MKPTQANRSCPQCEQPLPPDAPEGLCPECLMLGGLETMPLPEGYKPTGRLPETGETFGGYRIGRELGRGGMGAVFEAEQLETGRRVALKLLNHQLDSPESRARFLREGRLAASINHPNSVYVFGTEEIGEMPAIAMELVGGGTLEERVKEKGALSVGEAVDAAIQVIEGLEAAQEIGILHRDVKPGNCFQDVDGTVKVGDFGLSISTEARDEKHLTMEGAVFGTPAFSSPEQLRGEELNVRSDIYAVGATLFYLLTGRPAFRGKSIAQLFANVLEGPTPNPSDLRPGLPSGLVSVVVRCMQKMPVERFGSYAEMRRALEPFSSAAPVPAPVALRIVAGMADWMLYTIVGFAVQVAIFGGLVFLEEHEMGVTGMSFVISLLAWSLYFGITEGKWGASAGKAMCRLKVADANGNPPGFLKGAIRGWLFLGLPSLPTWIYASLDPLRFATGRDMGFSMLVSLTFYLILGLLFATARRRNGWASVIDLITGTRVIRRKAFQDRPELARKAITPVNADEETPRIGPFHVLESLNDEWSVGYDSRLLRKVWIRQAPVGSESVPVELRQLGRVGRLRWLAGRRSGDENWDAFEFPGGEALPVLAAKGSLTWSQVRYWLLDLSEELEASEKEGSTPENLSLDRVWITDKGRAKLLDFSIADHPGENPGNDPLTPSGLIDRVGALVNPPIPIHAIDFCRSLKSLKTPSEIVKALKPLIHRNVIVTRGRRAALVAACLFLPIFSTLLGMLGTQMFKNWAEQEPEIIALSEVLNYREIVPLLKLEDAPSDRLFSIYISSRYREVLKDPVKWNSAASRAMISEDHREFAERSLEDYPDPTEAELQEAVAAIGGWVELKDTSETETPNLMPLVVAAMDTLPYVGLPAVIAALICRGGLVMLVCGVAVARPDGTQASRLRCFWRSLITWSPWLVASSGLALFSQNLGSMATILISIGLAFVFALPVVSVWLPNRSLQDRLAGTCLVPR